MKKYKIDITYNTDIDRSVRYDNLLAQKLRNKLICTVLLDNKNISLSNTERAYIQLSLLNALKGYAELSEIFTNTIIINIYALNDFNNTIDEAITLFDPNKNYDSVYSGFLSDFLLSIITTIQISEFGVTYISSINNETFNIVLIGETTINQLIQSVESTDGSTQTYTVIDTENNPVVDGLVVESHRLGILAEDGETTQVYTISFS
jgi:hypothetical protein